MRRLISFSRYLIVIPCLGSFIAATALMVYGALEIAQVLGDAFSGPIGTKGAKALALAFIEVVDLFLLGTVLYIIALGLYELFVDNQVQLPAWLTIRDLDDLKDKLTGVVILVMGVLFLGQAVTWDGERDLLPYGAAIALVIAALTFFLAHRGRKPKPTTGKPGAAAASADAEGASAP